MLKGKICSITRFLTERTEGGRVMDPNESAGKPQGKSVMEVLLSKHPDQQIPDEEAFIQCEELPIFLDVEITASHIERVAHKLSGGAGPSGFTSSQLQDLLLKYGNHSAGEWFSGLGLHIRCGGYGRNEYRLNLNSVNDKSPKRPRQRRHP